MNKTRKPFYSLLSLAIFCIQYSYTILMLYTGFLTLFFKSDSGLQWVMQAWGKGILAIMGKRLRIHGIENIEPGKHYILLANHGSIYDIPAILSFFPRVSWLGRTRLLKFPLFGQLLRKTDYIPITPGNISNTRELLDRLGRKTGSLTVAIFPEGTRTLDGNLQRFRRGLLLLLANTQIDLLPVTLNGFYSLKPKNRFYIDPTVTIEAVIHKPIEKKGLAGKSDNQILGLLKSIIESKYVS